MKFLLLKCYNIILINIILKSESYTYLNLKNIKKKKFMIIFFICFRINIKI